MPVIGELSAVNPGVRLGFNEQTAVPTMGTSVLWNRRGHCGKTLRFTNVWRMSLRFVELPERNDSPFVQAFMFPTLITRHIWGFVRSDGADRCILVLSRAWCSNG